MTDPRTRTLVTVCVVAAVSFGVAAGLYSLFGKLNSAEVKWASEGIKLGGPIAGFAITFYLLMKYVERLASHMVSARDASAPYEGSWRLSSRSTGASTRVGFSNVTARVDEAGRMSMAGSFLDDKNQPIGEWSTNEVFCSPDGLAYRYQLTDRKSAEEKNWAGFCSVHVEKRDKKGRPIRMVGNWDVIASQKHHEGTISFER